MSTVSTVAPISLPAPTATIAIQQAVLESVLNIVKPAVSSKSSIAILSNVVLEVASGKLTATAYDLEVAIRRTVSVSGYTGMPFGSLVVDHKLLLGIVKGLKGAGELTLDFVRDRLVLSSSRNQFVLNGVDVEDYPDVPCMATEDAAWTVVMPAAALRSGLDRVLFATSREAQRAFTSGILFAPDSTPSSVRFVGTDGRRLASLGVPCEYEGEPGNATVIPARSLVSLLASVLPKDAAGARDLVTLQMGARFTVLEVGDTWMLMHNLDAQYPDYEKVIPQRFTGQVEVDRSDLVAAIKDCAHIAKLKEGRDMVILQSDGDRVSLRAQVDSVGSARAELRADQTGTQMRVAFNYQYVLDYLQHVNSDRIRLKYADVVDPGVMEPVSGESYQYVLMPVRLMD